MQQKEQDGHLPQVLGWVFDEQIRGCISPHIRKVLDRHLIILVRLCIL